MVRITIVQVVFKQDRMFTIIHNLIHVKAPVMFAILQINIHVNLVILLVKHVLILHLKTV